MAGGRIARPWRPVQRASKAAVTVAKKRGVTLGRGCFGARLRLRGLGFLCGLTVWQGRGPPAREHSIPGRLRLPGRVQEGQHRKRAQVWAVLWFGDSSLSSVNAAACCRFLLSRRGCPQPGPRGGFSGSRCPTSAVPLRLRKHQTRTREGERRGAVGCFGLTV